MKRFELGEVVYFQGVRYHVVDVNDNPNVGPWVAAEDVMGWEIARLPDEFSREPPEPRVVNRRRCQNYAALVTHTFNDIFLGGFLLAN